MIKLSIKYFLLLSVVLAFLPQQNDQQSDFVMTKNFVVVMDHLESLASSENTKKSDKETDDSHPLIQCGLLFPEVPVERVLLAPFFVVADPGFYYPIRAPPTLA